VLVAHDRYFMDRVVHKVWELFFGELETYSATTATMCGQRTERYEKAAEGIPRPAGVHRQGGRLYPALHGRRAHRRPGPVKRLERFKEDEAIDRPRQEQTIKLRCTRRSAAATRCVDQDLAIGYDRTNPLFRCPDLDSARECVALLDRTVGQDDFLKTVLGQQEPLAGHARWGPASRSVTTPRSTPTSIPTRACSTRSWRSRTCVGRSPHLSGSLPVHRRRCVQAIGTCRR